MASIEKPGYPIADYKEAKEQGLTDKSYAGWVEEMISLDQAIARNKEQMALIASGAVTKMTEAQINAHVSVAKAAEAKADIAVSEANYHKAVVDGAKPLAVLSSFKYAESWGMPRGAGSAISPLATL